MTRSIGILYFTIVFSTTIKKILYIFHCATVPKQPVLHEFVAVLALFTVIFVKKMTLVAAV